MGLNSLTMIQMHEKQLYVTNLMLLPMLVKFYIRKSKHSKRVRLYTKAKKKNVHQSNKLVLAIYKTMEVYL